MADTDCTDYDPGDLADRDALLKMFRRVPIGMLETTTKRLLNATRKVRTSRAMKKGEDGVERPDTIDEPAYDIQFKTLELVITQRIGRPDSRKLPEPPPPKDDKADSGSLKPLKAAKAKKAAEESALER